MRESRSQKKEIRAETPNRGVGLEARALVMSQSFHHAHASALFDTDLTSCKRAHKYQGRMQLSRGKYSEKEDICTGSVPLKISRPRMPLAKMYSRSPIYHSTNLPLPMLFQLAQKRRDAFYLQSLAHLLQRHEMHLEFLDRIWRKHKQLAGKRTFRLQGTVPYVQLESS